MGVGFFCFFTLDNFWFKNIYVKSYLQRVGNIYIYIYIYIYIHTQPQAGCDTVNLLSRVQWVWVWFCFSKIGFQTRAKKNSACLFTFSWHRTDGFMPFPRALAQNETQSASSRIELRSQISFSTIIQSTPSQYTITCDQNNSRVHVVNRNWI